MSDELKDLKNIWGKAQSSAPTPSLSASEIVATSNQRFSKIKWMHMATIAILSITFIGIGAFFYYVAPMQDTLSRIGIVLMLGGLLLRIGIELVSIGRASRLDFTSSAANNHEKYGNYYRYRLRIHGPITISILVAYTIGFYLLIPEFSRYFDTVTTWLLALSYIPAAAIFGFSIRKGIRNEKAYLREIMMIWSDLKE